MDRRFLEAGLDRQGGLQRRSPLVVRGRLHELRSRARPHLPSMDGSEKDYRKACSIHSTYHSKSTTLQQYSSIPAQNLHIQIVRGLLCCCGIGYLSPQFPMRSRAATVSQSPRVAASGHPLSGRTSGGANGLCVPNAHIP